MCCYKVCLSSRKFVKAQGRKNPIVQAFTFFTVDLVVYCVYPLELDNNMAKFKRGQLSCFVIPYFFFKVYVVNHNFYYTSIFARQNVKLSLHREGHTLHV